MPNEVEALATAPIEEEKELVLAFQRGEDGSYQAIYERYAPRVSGICGRMLAQPQDAEEAQQEAFMKVFTSLPRFNGRYQLGAWISRIATNVCLDHIRTRVRRPADSADHEMLDDLATTSADAAAEDIFIRGAERNRVREVLARLSPTYRAALALREFEGMSYADIAIALGMTEPQVKALIHRARRSFKKHWSPGLAALLPWRLIARFRRFSSHYDAPPQVADAAVSSAHAAVSCSTILQQCSQIIGERVAPAVAGLVIGATAIAGGTGAGQDPARRGVAVSISAPRSDTQDGKSVEIEDQAKRRRGPSSRVVKEPEPAATPEGERPASATAPSTEPSPEAPTASPSPSPDEGGRPQESPPQSTPPALGFDRGTPIPAVVPRVATTTLDCKARTVDQRLDTTVANATENYPIIFEFASGALKMTITRGENTVGYNGGGALVNATERGGVLTLIYQGSYSWDGRGYPSSASLPESGSLYTEFKVDCVEGVVIKQSVVFGVN